MKEIFTLLAAFEILILSIWLVFVSLKKKRRSSATLISLAAGVLAILSVTLCFSYSSSQFVALILSGCRFALLDWLIVFMTVNILRLPYSGKTSRIEYSILNFIVALAMMDSLSCLLNFIFTHMAEITPVYCSFGRIYTWYFSFNLAFYLHAAFCYLEGCVFIFLGILRISKFPPAYQDKYYILIFVFFAAALAHAFYIIMGWTFDFSVLLYILVLYALFYFVFQSIPKEFSGFMMEQVALNMSSAVICYDLDGKCLFANNLAHKLFTKNIKENKNLFIEAYLTKWKKFHPDSNGVIHIEDDCFVLDGDIHTFAGELRTLKDKKNRLIGYLIKLDDRTEYLNALEQEKYLANHDPLTGLLNRRAFFETAEDILRTAPASGFYFVCSDIEDFKLINDIFGEEAGNEILIGQARTFEKISYPDCIHGRISGDKFAMLIAKDDFNQRYIEKLFEDYQKSLTQRYHYRVKIGIGVFEVEDSLEDVQLMCDKADMAIQKNTGNYAKNIFFYDTVLMKERIEAQAIYNDFLKALEKKEFGFYIQPQFDTRTNSVNGGEALVRWNHPVNGIMSPNLFVPVLEKTDYISDLDYCIWEKVAKTLRDWKDKGFENYYLSVNISAKDFYYIDVYEVLTGLVKKYEINPKNMNLEVTETILMSNVAMHQNILSRLRDFGFTIEMDDFGSGYSSLSTLRNLSMDVLKIDMEFLRSTENYGQSLKIINGIIDMAKSLDMTVITEGVEVENQANALKEMGCDIFQGYYFSRPIPVDVFEKKYMEKE